ncbi:hypothetical protein HaLaN_28048 [Haematococcus lacustris]|uniref:Uncharacterized protein n=1 Tax=Haematococcus lacustris TaxID=44745 RepID=A0A6A0AAR8_HAELA|nr:hypothetical protein HaLaN_28048 [Haematococcus lacustris]
MAQNPAQMQVQGNRSVLSWLCARSRSASLRDCRAECAARGVSGFSSETSCRAQACCKRGLPARPWQPSASANPVRMPS